MFRMAISAVLVALTALSTPAFAAERGTLASGTGNLLRGAVYKQNGTAREGLITLRTSWKLPAAPPVFRYDFDILYGNIDGNLYNYLMADVAEIEMLPPEGGAQPVNVKLRNGLVQKVTLSSDNQGILGLMNLKLKEADVVTNGYGENIIDGGDIQKIVFYPPYKPEEETAAGLAGLLGKAIEIGKRDGLVDDDFRIILEKIQGRLKEKLQQ